MQQDYLQQQIDVLNKDPALRLPKDVNILMKGTKDITFFKNYINNGEKRVHILCCTYMKHQANNIGEEVVKIGEINDKLFILLKGEAGLMVLQPKITKQQQDEFETVLKDQENKEGDNKRLDQNKEAQGNEEVEQRSKQITMNEIQEKRARNTSQVANEEAQNQKKEKNNLESRNSITTQENNLKFRSLEGKKQQLNVQDANKLNSLQVTKSQIQITSDQNNIVFQEPVMELVQVKLLEKGDIFGEVSLVQNRPSIFSVCCLTECQFAILEKKEFDFILGQLEEQRIYREMRFLGGLDYFMHWSANQIKYLYVASKTVSFQRNQFVFQEDDPADYIYIVKSGMFEKVKNLNFEMEKDICFLDLQGASEQLIEKINLKYRLFYMQNDKRKLRLSTIEEKELFGEEDILNKQNKRSFSVICVSQQGDVVMIKKRDFYQKVLDSDQTKRMVKYRNKQKKIVMEENTKKYNSLIQEYKQYLMDNCQQNLKQVNLQEYLQTSNQEIKQSGISELLPLNLNTNLIHRYKTGQESQSLVQQYLNNTRYQRINLKRRIYEKVNSVTNVNEQSNLLMEYVNNYQYAEPYGVVQIEFNRQKPQPRKEFQDRIKELQGKQEKLRVVLRKLQRNESLNFIEQNKSKTRSISSSSSINSKIIHTPISEIRKQNSTLHLNPNQDQFSKNKQNQIASKEIQKSSKLQRSLSYNDSKVNQKQQRMSEEINIFKPQSYQCKIRNYSSIIQSNNFESDEDISPKKTLASERDSIRSSDIDKSLRNTISNLKKQDSKDSLANQNEVPSDFKQCLHNIIKVSNNYEKIATHMKGFPIRIKTSHNQRDQVYYKKLNSSISNSYKIQNNFKLDKNNVPLIKDFNKINSCLGIQDN
ncbi:cyclic nucleotide-binding domain protein (macronuclear) [Tetrahymena thermophila SB210]|uniref:Cyclic nucleotide-binding domain protein n=1 Tax=Tetrahymena thermophila (strain SB210) TaxID=312017 RepID=I7LSW5_TETTS|nr:cyclic nucleotide-binding domain protein [Tetrahymena thermophila SB210]EAR83747.2 cyclic nucleotide-binding domain protein [Tetrahymena thermophila SB210]|eukprot:XP_001031410.2 cyclic nucleotide-binding domain protein [Tetrahymena thermophila SB210]